MARYKDDKVTAALGQHLHQGEQLYHWAYGVKQPNMGLIMLLFLLAILPGAIAVALLTKEYVVGLTNYRFIVMQVSGGNIKVKQILEYDMSQPMRVKTSAGSIFTHIRIDDPQRPFVAKFHRMGMTNNKDHSRAIAAALETRKAA